jgi:hypothetical protein
MHAREVGPREETAATTELERLGMTIRQIDGRAFATAAERLWESEGRALGVDHWLSVIRA